MVRHVQNPTIRLNGHFLTVFFTFPGPIALFSIIVFVSALRVNLKQLILQDSSKMIISEQMNLKVIIKMCFIQMKREFHKRVNNTQRTIGQAQGFSITGSSKNNVIFNFIGYLFTITMTFWYSNFWAPSMACIKSKDIFKMCFFYFILENIK